MEGIRYCADCVGLESPWDKKSTNYFCKEYKMGLTCDNKFNVLRLKECLKDDRCRMGVSGDSLKKYSFVSEWILAHADVEDENWDINTEINRAKQAFGYLNDSCKQGTGVWRFVRKWLLVNANVEGDWDIKAAIEQAKQSYQTIISHCDIEDSELNSSGFDL